MRLGLHELEAYWREAVVQRPVVVFGAGRWGRVWAELAAGLAGGGVPVILVARGNADEARAWRRETPSREKIDVAADPASALQLLVDVPRRDSAIAIVASRPRDHLRDVDVCLAHGLPPLVEKPFSPDTATARRHVELARSRSLAIGLGAEFALLPALHWLADKMGDWSGDMILEWADPAQEVRHGAEKRAHPEAPLIIDLAAHAAAIFDVAAPSPKGSAHAWRMVSVAQDAPGTSGSLELAGSGIRALLVARRDSSRRVRKLNIACDDGRRFTLDFASAVPHVIASGAPQPIPPRYLALDSTLRLELGAWLRYTGKPGRAAPPPMASMIDSHIDLCEAITARLAA